jgi:hypothetical protein
MFRPPSCHNVIAYPDIRASTRTCESETVGLGADTVVDLPVQEQDRGALLGEAFVILSQMNVGELAQWVSGLRSSLEPGSGAG